jgi:hypothetical protein
MRKRLMVFFREKQKTWIERQIEWALVEAEIALVHCPYLRYLNAKAPAVMRATLVTEEENTVDIRSAALQP